MAASLPKFSGIVYELSEVNGYIARKYPSNQGAPYNSWPINPKYPIRLFPGGKLVED